MGAGDYSIYTQPGEPFFALVINKQIYQFHTEYHSDQDLGRVPMTTTRLETPVERLTFVIEPLPAGRGVLKLRWDTREYAVTIAGRRFLQ